MNKHVFVSSTFKDLVTFREKVRGSIRQLGAVDISMEHFGARDARPKEECIRLIEDETDVFVGIYAFRYGYIPEEDAISITETEYHAAGAAGIPRHIYLVDESLQASWDPAWIDQGTSAQQLAAFKAGLQKNRIGEFFSNPDQLAASVAADLGRHFSTTPSTTQELTLRLPRTQEREIVGRKDDLLKIKQRLFEQQSLVLVNGLGGIGKTTLAQVYVDKFYRKYRHIAWVDELTDTFESNLVNATGLLPSLEIKPEGKELKDLFTETIMKLKEIPGPNLLVIDNANDTLSSYYDVLPKPPSWHILVTSRENIERFETMELGFLSESEALALFQKHYQREQLSEAEIATIVKLVDYHTLTIEILAKTAQKQRTDLQKLSSAIESDLKANVYVQHQGAKIDRITSYLCSIFELTQLSEHEHWLLKQLACLPPEFHTYDQLVDLIDPAQSEKQEIFSETLEEQRDKGWVLYNEITDQYKMHRIIGAVVVRQIPPTPEEVSPLINRVIDLLEIDSNEANPVDKFQWVPYGQTLNQIFDTTEYAVLVTLRHNLAVVHRVLGEYDQAKFLLERVLNTEIDRVLALDKINFDSDHARIIRIFTDLALAYKALGEYGKSKNLLERVLVANEEKLGFDHPDTAITASYLARVHKGLGDFGKAKSLLKRALVSAEKNFESDHLNMAIIAADLGIVHKDLGDFGKAKSLLKRALVSAEKNLGPDHPDTATSSSNLATVHIALGKYDQAKVLLEKALASAEKNFGPDHPNTATKALNLGVVHRDLGEYNQAKPLLERALTAFENHFSPDHPETLAAKSHLEVLIKEMNK